MLPQTYRDRNDILKEMGYSSYQQYLDSPLWKQIREQAYKRKGRECIVCYQPATVIHHRGYGEDVLKGKDLGPLVPLCEKCHYRVEFKEEGEKKSLKAAERTLSAILRNLGQSKGKHSGICKSCGKKAQKKSVFCGPCMTPEEEEITGTCVLCFARAATIKGNICHPCLINVIAKKKVWDKVGKKGKKTKNTQKPRCPTCGKMKKKNRTHCRLCKPKGSK